MEIKKALKKYFGFDEFRSGQFEIIEEIISGNSVLAVLPTGAGKSLCYQIPALVSDNYSIVISPLIALMKDQVDSLNTKGEVAAFINSTQSFVETEKVLQDIAFGKIKLVYVAPERLENKDFALRLKNMNPQFLFIDEAHCISEWGHNFRPSYTKLSDFIEYTGIKKISAFTATATPEVIKDIIRQLNLKNAKLIIKGFERDNLFLNVEITKRKKERCLELIYQHKSPAIIYTSSRKKTEELAEYLQFNKVNCNYYHAGLDPIIRKKIQEDFIEDRTKIIIATNAFGMGIDKSNIRLVIHYNMPGTIENYYQEIGRAGRDGKYSYTYLLYDENDINIHNYFINNSYPTKELIKTIYDAVCDSAQIAVGNFSDKEIIIDHRYIQSYAKQEISNALLHSSLRYLEDAGYFKVNSVFRSTNKIKILFEQNRLKNFIKKTTNEFIKEILLHLVKNYGNEIFIRATSFNTDHLQNETGLTNTEISDTINTLEYLGIVEFSRPNGKETISLIQPRVKSDKLKLKFKLINEFYISAKQKLDKIVDYVYTNECRFKFILNYFGENVSDYSCGKCDNCLKTTTSAEPSENYIKDSIVNLLEEYSSPISEKEITKILLGQSADKEFKKLINFSTLKDYNQSEIKKAIRILQKEEIITTSDKNKNLFLLAEKFDLIQSDDFIESKNEIKYDNDLELFHLLRGAREKTAKKFLQSPGIICPDSVLSKISKEKPKTKYELLAISGFNERMYNKIGNDLLEIINGYDDKSLKADKRDKPQIPGNVSDTFSLLKQNYKLEEIAKLRKLTEAVISMQIETILEYLPDTDISGIIEKQMLDLIRDEFKKGTSSLKELKENLPNDFSYPLIRIALAKLKAEAS